MAWEASSNDPMGSYGGWIISVDSDTHKINLQTFWTHIIKRTDIIHPETAKALGAALIAASNHVESLPPLRSQSCLPKKT